MLVILCTLIVKDVFKASSDIIEIVIALNVHLVLMWAHISSKKSIIGNLTH